MFEKLQAHLQEVLHELERTSSTAGVVDVPQKLLDESDHIVDSFLKKIQDTEAVDSALIALMQKLFDAWKRLYGLICDGWEVPAIRRQARHLEQLIDEIYQIEGDKTRESPSSFSYIVGSDTPYQQALEIAELYRSGAATQAQQRVRALIQEVFLCPYNSYRMRAVMQVFPVIFHAGGIEEVLFAWRLLGLEFRDYADVALLAVIAEHTFEEVDQAAVLIPRLRSDSRRDEGYSLLFDLAIKSSIEQALSICKKIVNPEIRYTCMASAASAIAEDDSERAKEIAHQITASSLRTKILRKIDYLHWDKYVRRVVDHLPETVKEDAVDPTRMDRMRN